MWGDGPPVVVLESMELRLEFMGCDAMRCGILGGWTVSDNQLSGETISHVMI